MIAENHIKKAGSRAFQYHWILSRPVSGTTQEMVSFSCLLPLLLASVFVADAFTPAIASKTSLLLKVRNFCQNNANTKTSTTLKSGEDELPPSSVSVEEISRGGGLNDLKGKPPALPTFAEYRKFAIPCFGLWVSQSLLSLVDTSFVGLSAGTDSATQLAALGPATTFFDGSTYLFAFLNVATTNLYSSARAQWGEASDQAEAVVCTASRVALRCGIGIMLFLWAFARPLLALYIGMCRVVNLKIIK